MHKKKRPRYSFINRSIFTFAILIVVTSALLYMHFREIIAINPAVIGVVKFFLSSAIVIVITIAILRSTVDSIFRMFENDLDIEQRILLTKVYAIFFYSIAASIILLIGGVGLNDITLFLGLITTGIALAVRDIIMSFFIWLIILTKRPFRIGDVVTSADDTGIVDRIGTYYFTLRAVNGQETHIIRVPNKMFLDRNLKNHGKNRISGEISLQVKTIPRNINTWYKNVSTALDRIGDIHSHIDTDGDKLLLVIRYTAEYDKEKALRLSILSLLFSKHRKIFKEGS